MHPVKMVRELFKDEEELSLTDGNIGRSLFHLSMPIVIMNLFQTTYNLVDTFWLGQYDTEALAATSFTFPMVLLYISIGIGISTGGSILVAQHLGGNEHRLATRAASQTLTLSVVGALIFGALGYLFVDDVLAIIGASPRVLALSVAYMRIISLGLVFMFGFFTFMTLMRGAGDTVTPMLVVAGSVGLNLVLDPLLIFGWGPFPEWGIRGAAIATIISRTLAFGVGLWVMIRSDAGINIRIGDLRPTLHRALTQFRLAIPASVEGVSRTLSLTLLLLIVGVFPTTVVAGYGIGTRVLSLVYLPAIAVARGIETMTGQNIGATQPDRAATATGIAGGFLFVTFSGMGVLTWLWAEAIVGLFTTDAEVTQSGSVFLRYIAPTFGFIGLMRVCNASFRGAGQTLTAAVIVLLMHGLIRLPGAHLGATSLGSTGVWTAIAVTNVIGAILAYSWYRLSGWQTEIETPSCDHAEPAPADD